MLGRALERELGIGALAGPAAVVDRLERIARERALGEVIRELVEPRVGAMRVRGSRARARPASACARAGWWSAPRTDAERTSACANVYRPTAPGTSRTIECCTAWSSASNSSSPPGPPAASIVPRSNCAPITAATASARLAASDRRESRRPTTSRMPSGMPASSSVRSLVQRPSRCTIAPDSARWRSTSPTKNGLPCVSRCTRHRESSTPGLVEVVTGDRLHQRRHLRLVEAGEVEPADTPGSRRRVGEHLGERMSAVEVGVAVRREDEQPHRRTGTEHVAEQQQRRLVGPVHVVEHEDHRDRSATSRRGSRSPPRTVGDVRSPGRPAPVRRARARAPRDREACA